jgi:hypothetical protein
MLVIRSAQMAALQAHLIDDFVARVCRHVREHDAERARHLSDRKLDDLVRLAIQRGADYELNSEWAACALAHVVLRYGPEFDRDSARPWVPQLLCDPFVVDPELRLGELLDRALVEMP